MYNICRYFDTYFEAVVKSGFKTEQEAKKELNKKYHNSGKTTYHVRSSKDV